MRVLRGFYKGFCKGCFRVGFYKGFRKRYIEVGITTDTAYPKLLVNLVVKGPYRGFAFMIASRSPGEPSYPATLRYLQ